jgi:hypothetical protein
MKIRITIKSLIIILSIGGTALAGPYNEAGISGFVDANGKTTLPSDPNKRLNPIFSGWATGVASYEPTPYVDYDWMNYQLALGPATGNQIDVVSLGDLYQEDIDAGVPVGKIRLTFENPIYNGKGYDFVVFENAQLWGNLYFCELAYVEVSSDGAAFAIFPSVSLSPYDSGGPIIPDYRCIDITDVHNLAGKHPNGYGFCTGTPFDLSELENEPNVQNGSVDLNDIAYVRIVDIPGSGDFNDEGRKFIDPCTWPDWTYYDANHPIYDAWVTYGSGGFDLEAIGVLYPQEYGGDINLDGIVDYEDLKIFAQGWLSHFGQKNYLSRCDLAQPKDLIVDFSDFAVFAQGWLRTEEWRSR